MFVDGPALKGGTGSLAARTAWSAVVAPFAALPLISLALFAALVVRIARHPQRFSLKGPDELSTLSPRDVGGVFGLGLLLFGAGALWLAMRTPVSNEWARAVIVLSLMLVGLTTSLAVVFFFGNLGADQHANGRAFNAAALATLVLGSTVSLSMTTLNPAYENNPIIAVALIALFVAIDRARLAWLRWPVLAAAMAMPLGWRLPRAAIAVHPVTDDGFFRGMRVSDAGLEIVKAAQHARELARPAGEVLVLPEDPSLAALIGRPRPPLCGAIVFPDQYPERCVASDLRLLDRRPPAVVMVRPGETEKWLSFLRTFNAGSPTEKLMTSFFDAHLGDYERVASQNTHWMGGVASLVTWQRRKPSTTR
jgi:hypothetical protein